MNWKSDSSFHISKAFTWLIKSLKSHMFYIFCRHDGSSCCSYRNINAAAKWNSRWLWNALRCWKLQISDLSNATWRCSLKIAIKCLSRINNLVARNSISSHDDLLSKSIQEAISFGQLVLEWTSPLWSIHLLLISLFANWCIISTGFQFHHRLCFTLILFFSTRKAKGGNHNFLSLTRTIRFVWLFHYSKGRDSSFEYKNHESGIL